LGLGAFGDTLAVFCSYLHQRLFPCPFEELLTLHLDIRGGHGNDAAQVHQLLHSARKLTSLSLELPSCDRETCRVQGITYDYHFPALTSFSLRGWADSRSRLPEFLLRHRSIKSLYFDIFGDDEDTFKITATALPSLRAVAAENISRPQLLLQLLKSPAALQITHIRLGQVPQKSTSLPILANYVPSLRCLELSNIDVNFWRKEPKVRWLKRILTSLPGLVELALRCSTRDTLWNNEAGVWVQPDPMDMNDLVR
jgi:hypothetical protein